MGSWGWWMGYLLGYWGGYIVKSRLFFICISKPYLTVKLRPTSVNFLNILLYRQHIQLTLNIPNNINTPKKQPDINALPNPCVNLNITAYKKTDKKMEYAIKK